AQLRQGQTQRLHSNDIIQPLPEAVDMRSQLEGLLEAMGYRITDEKAIGANLYFLCDMKWGAEILQEVVFFVGAKPTATDIASLNDAVLSYGAGRGILLTSQPLSPVLQDLSRQRDRIHYYTLDEFTDRLASFG